MDSPIVDSREKVNSDKECISSGKLTIITIIFERKGNKMGLSFFFLNFSLSFISNHIEISTEDLKLSSL